MNRTVIALLFSSISSTFGLYGNMIPTPRAPSVLNPPVIVTGKTTGNILYGKLQRAAQLTTSRLDTVPAAAVDDRGKLSSMLWSSFAMASEMTSQLKLTAMGMMDKVVRRLEHGRVVSAWGSWVWYVDEGNRREGLLRRCMSQLVRAHEGRGWRRWVWCTEESRRREEYATLSGMSERERAAVVQFFHRSRHPARVVLVDGEDVQPHVHVVRGGAAYAARRGQDAHLGVNEEEVVGGVELLELR